MFKTIKTFYQDLRKYDYDKKWMCFDFFVRQPLGCILSIVALVIMTLQIKDRMSFVSVTINAVYLLLWLLLLILVYIRKKYSYVSYHVLLVLQALYMLFSSGFTGWSLALSIVVHLVFLALSFKYYYYRFDFFYFDFDKKNATIEELKKRGKIAKRAGVILGVQILFLGTVCGISFYIQNWISKPAANMEYLSDAENPMIDMNKVVGEEEKENLRQLNFSEEEITQLLSGAYSEEDIAFIKALVGASEVDEYQRVFEQNPDKLSVYTQDALYGYIYNLMSESIGYDENLIITRQEFERLQTVINGILKTGNGCGRYLRILADMSTYHMEQIEEELRTNYKDKQVVISLIPEYAMHVQLNTLFETLIQSLNYTTGFFLQDVMQIEQLGLDNDISYVRNDTYRIDEVCFSYKEKYDNRQETEYMLIYKESGFDGATDMYIDERISPEQVLQTYYFGDVITCPDYRWNPVILFGTYDIGTLLKRIWLEEEGYSSFFEFDEDEVTRIAQELKSEAHQIELAKQKIPYYEMYLLWTGEPCTKEDGSLCPIQKLSDIPLENFESDLFSLHHYMNDSAGFDYKEYNILDEYYFKDK